MPTPRSSLHPARHTQGFTLLEILMVMAMISILVAIIIPAVGGAQTSAKRAKTRVQFSQWSAAIEQFRQEYGYYPNWGTANSGDQFSDGLIHDSNTTRRFVECLSGRALNGASYPDTAAGFLAGNTKRIQFLSFSESELTREENPRLQDAFGNTEIGVLVDRNLNGMITFGAAPADYVLSAIATSVQIEGTTSTVSVPIDGETNIRAGVAFYSAGDGQRPVTSW